MAGMPVGIGDAKTTQYVALGPFHRFRVGIAFMIVADEVKKSMHRQMGEVMRERLALGLGLARDGLVGQHDVAEMRRVVRGALGRKRQYVGGRIDTAPKPVELADGRIIGQNNSKLRPGC